MCHITAHLKTDFFYTHSYTVRDGSCAQTLGKQDTQSSEHQETHASMEPLNRKQDITVQLIWQISIDHEMGLINSSLKLASL